MNAFQETKHKTLKRLCVNEQSGLTNEEVFENRKKYGSNTLTPPETVSIWQRIWEALTEPMLIMLIVAALIAFGVNFARSLTGGHAEYIECAGILAAIAVSVAITVVTEGRSAKAFEALSRIQQNMQVKVFRNAEVCLLPQTEIVVGDIVCLSTGDKIPADGRLIETVDFQCDESSLTGESVPVSKSAEIVFETPDVPVAERKNMVYSGSFVTSGTGRMVVVCVGDKTEFGQIARELSNVEKGETPLQEKLGHLGKLIAICGTAAAAVVFLIQTAGYILNGTATLENISEAFITSIVLIVAAVPEGLPTTVAVSLAVNIMKMTKQNALVKKMIACETIGCINVICSDKTGTLTENKMTVVAVSSKGELHKPDALKDEFLLTNFALNSTSEIDRENGGRFIGNPTECALLAAADKAGRDYRSYRSGAEILHVYPFSSETKNMTTVVRGEGGIIAYSKGSPEKILSMCALLPEDLTAARLQIEGYQKKACRVIAFSHKVLEENTDYDNARPEIESDMLYDGFVAISDPLRGEVAEAVASCRSAGIDLKMLTGDNIITARAIAEELEMLDEKGITVEARDIEAMSDEELKAALPDIRVIARSTPLIKMRVVKALKSLGHVVAVTGDGINDAPAIKNADVGIAMGISGTEVSKEAGDIVLLDDSFATIVKAVHWGRGIYENFQRFLQFQLTVNLASVAVVLTTVLMGLKAPFTALQLLWVNIIMDGPPALTLGMEPIRKSLMDRRPTPRGAPIVTKRMLFRILFNGILISGVMIAQNLWNFLDCLPEQKGTVFFTLFVVFQLLNAFNCRELTDESIFKNLTHNHLMLGVFAATFLLQFVITQYGGVVFGTVPLPLGMWGKIMLTGLSVIAAAEAFKWIRRRLA